MLRSGRKTAIVIEVASPQLEFLWVHYFNQAQPKKCHHKKVIIKMDACGDGAVDFYIDVDGGWLHGEVGLWSIREKTTAAEFSCILKKCLNEQLTDTWTIAQLKWIPPVAWRCVLYIPTVHFINNWLAHIMYTTKDLEGQSGWGDRKQSPARFSNFK